MLPLHATQVYTLGWLVYSPVPILPTTFLVTGSATTHGLLVSYSLHTGWFPTHHLHTFGGLGGFLGFGCLGTCPSLGVVSCHQDVVSSLHTFPTQLPWNRWSRPLGFFGFQLPFGPPLLVYLGFLWIPWLRRYLPSTFGSSFGSLG